MLWLERTPIWLIGVLILIGLIVAEQLGYAARRVSRGGPEPSNESVGYIVTGALALLGLLVAFTFSAASDRYDTRRQLVVEEANALGTTYLRAQALDPAPRAALSPLIAQYAHARDRWLQAGEDAAQIARAQAETEALQDRIWAATVADIRANPTATINPSLLQTTNDMFDVSASIRAAFDGRLPISILRAMIAYALIAAAIMGFAMAAERRQAVLSAALYLALAVAICLILDLDRPRAGSVTLPRAPMDRAIAAIDVAEAARAKSPPAP